MSGGIQKLQVNGRPVRALIIDDDPFLAGIYDFGLKQAGCAVAVFHNGRKAMEAAEKDPPDIVICDLMMPDIDGFETLGLFRANRRLQDIPFVVLSSLTHVDDIQKALSLGAADYLKKTEVLPKDCVDKVRKVLGIKD